MVVPFKEALPHQLVRLICPENNYLILVYIENTADLEPSCRENTTHLDNPNYRYSYTHNIIIKVSGDARGMSNRLL